METLTDELLEQIEDDMVFGYLDEQGLKAYPTLKESAEWYNVSYESLRQKARKWNWKQRRQEHIQKVNRKVRQKKKSEEISEVEAEAIVVDDAKFNKAATKLRRAAVKELEDILEGNQVLKVLDDGTIIRGKKAAAYQLMNIGKALESAQKISKTAAGEPSEITQNTIQSQGKYEVTKRIICSPKHIEHELSVLNAAGKAQGCSK